MGFAYKVKYPENFFQLRGNHECASITRIYGFYDECKRRYNIKMWKQFCDVFNCFPVCGLIDEKIICMHGGLSPEITAMDQAQDSSAIFSGLTRTKISLVVPRTTAGFRSY